MTKKNYEILKISENASKSEIRKAYINLARTTHPDKGGNEEEFKKVNEAYEILIDENKRREYDKGESVSVEKYGYDYGEEFEEGELAISKYTDANSIDAMNKAWLHLFAFYIAPKKDREENPVSDYHLIRAKNLLKLLDLYYRPKYLAAENEIDRAEVTKDFIWWDNSSGQNNFIAWKNNYERAKRFLNYARKEQLGLGELTDKDLKFIKQPEPEKINIDEYNNLWIKGEHETIHNYWQLRGKIYDTAEEYKKFQNVNPELFEKMDNKAIEAERGDFQSIWNEDKEDKIREAKEFNEGKLNKMSEAMKLMEQLFAEREISDKKKRESEKNSEDKKSENQKNNNSSKSNSAKSEKVENNFHKVESNIRKEEKERSSKVESKLKEIINKAKSQENYTELKASLEEINKNEGEEIYENRKEEVNKLKEKLANLDENKYRQDVITNINTKLNNKESNSKVSLDKEIQQKVDQVKSGEITEINAINEVENLVTESVNKKQSYNILEQLVNKVKVLKEQVAKKVKEDLQTIKKQSEDLTKKILEFKFSSNSFQQSAYLKLKEKTENSLKELKNIDFSEANWQSNSGKSFFRPEVLVPTTLLGLLIVLAIVVIRARRKTKK